MQREPRKARPRIQERYNVFLPAELRERVKRVAEARMCSEAAAIRWLISRSLDWWEGLARDEREAV